MSREAAQYHLAWLMWCWNEGYVTPADRAGMVNWLTEARPLVDSDVQTRDALLQMADEVLTAFMGVTQ